MAARKSPQEVAEENLVTAKRVLVKAEARVEKTAADAAKAVTDRDFAKRKVRAAEILVNDEILGDTIDPNPSPAAVLAAELDADESVLS